MANMGSDFDKALKKYQKKLDKELINQSVAGFIQISNQIIKASPVLTGRFRGNWIPSLGVPNVGTIYPGGDLSVPDAAAVFKPTNGLNTEYFLTNNLPYAIPLAEGHSAQAASGWIDVSLTNGIYKLQQALNNIKINGVE